MGGGGWGGKQEKGGVQLLFILCVTSGSNLVPSIVQLCPYPTEEELQMRLQTSVDWDAYRQTTLADTLKSMRMRKEVRA